jgi:hypothetical protein
MAGLRADAKVLADEDDDHDLKDVVVRKNANLEVVVAAADGPVVNSHKDTILPAWFQ